MNNIAGDNGGNFARNSRYFTICTKYLMATAFTSVGLYK